eukprot:15430941-Alexandrium_andersonii.AAC.1
MVGKGWGKDSRLRRRQRPRQTIRSRVEKTPPASKRNRTCLWSCPSPSSAHNRAHRGCSCFPTRVHRRAAPSSPSLRR